MPIVTTTIHGQPVPQPRPRVSTRGGFGRAYVPSRHPVHAWREAIRRGYRGPRFRNGVSVRLQFVFQRPPSHFKRAGELTAAGARQQHPKPDVDNLAKSVLDALNGVAWVDDSQVEELLVTKVWGEGSRCVIEVASEGNE